MFTKRASLMQNRPPKSDMLMNLKVTFAKFMKVQIVFLQQL